jgi:hypothetical protein
MSQSCNVIRDFPQIIIHLMATPLNSTNYRTGETSCIQCKMRKWNNLIVIAVVKKYRYVLRKFRVCLFGYNQFLITTVGPPTITAPERCGDQKNSGNGILNFAFPLEIL